MNLGEEISHYRVLTLLGAGGMGEVYKAEDTKLKRAVALKFLPLALVRDKDAKERLVHEAQAASALDHPNICTIHEIDETSDGRVFIAMAYYEGETLKERIARGRLDADDAIDIIVKIGRAVSAAHHAGIVHRDIKPANVILTTRGEVKLLDFGIAKQSGQTELTRTGTTVGTVAYMAPEQVSGQGADERSDVWSLGVVLYEMLAGRPPFTGANELAVVRAIADTQPPPLHSLRPELPAAIRPIVDKALQKEARDRYATSAAFLGDVEVLRAPTGPLTADRTAAATPPRTTAGGRRLAIAAAALVALTAGGWFVYRQSQVRAARQTLRQVEALVEKQQFSSAFMLLRSIEPRLGSDPQFVKVRDSFQVTGPVQTEPPGADLYVKPYADVNGRWEYLGQSPRDIHGPIAYFRWRVSKPGFETFEGASALVGASFTLAPAGSQPSNMVRVPGATFPVGTDTVRLLDFFMDRFEVTNRDFKAFMAAGGYRKPEFWTEPFMKDGHPLSWDEAMAEFRDATGRPGPSTWELGTYPDGQDEYPVHGVSWYEAAAYARYAEHTLPTVYHWRIAAGLAGPLNVFSEILESSNFLGKGPAKVGEFQGISPFGIYDLAGNVKEWCVNAVGDHRYILGGAWSEPNYQFRDADARPPFDRTDQNGFRTIKIVDPSGVPDTALRPVERLTRDYSQEKPVGDDTFRVYAGLYNYDRTDLKPSVESVDDSSPAWRVERITYGAAYGNERIIAYLFLPKTAAPPYQTVVYFPHGGSLQLHSFEKGEMAYLGFIVKAGRALLLPMYKGTYERRLTAPPSGPNGARDLTVQQIKDLSRSLDYLHTRTDVDHERIAYFGTSFGAWMAAIALAVEHRFKTAVIWSGGLVTARRLPDVDPVNYISRVTTPLLMLNGRDDFTFPVDSSQMPMFRMLGTPEKDKRRILYDGGHIFPFARVEKDTLEWLDRYLGVPKSAYMDSSRRSNERSA